jgi:hypothetical protein
MRLEYRVRRSGAVAQQQHAGLGHQLHLLTERAMALHKRVVQLVALNQSVEPHTCNVIRRAACQ